MNDTKAAYFESINCPYRKITDHNQSILRSSWTSLFLNTFSSFIKYCYPIRRIPKSSNKSVISQRQSVVNKMELMFEFVYNRMLCLPFDYRHILYFFFFSFFCLAPSHRLLILITLVICVIFCIRKRFCFVSQSILNSFLF